jgi:hypothetical protein
MKKYDESPISDSLSSLPEEDSPSNTLGFQETLILCFSLTATKTIKPPQPLPAKEVSIQFNSHSFADSQQSPTLAL